MTSPGSGIVSASVPDQIQAATTMKASYSAVSAAVDRLAHQSQALPSVFSGAASVATMNMLAELHGNVKNRCAAGHEHSDHVITAANSQQGVSEEGAKLVQRAGAGLSSGISSINQ